MNNKLFDSDEFDPVSIITKAANTKTTVMINYNDSKGDGSAREVEPYELRDDSLYAYCLSKGSIRRFKLDGISGAIATNNVFVPKWEIKI